MQDDTMKHATEDAALISLTEDYEIQYWTQKFGVSGEQLADAIRAVGHSTRAVDAHLKQSRSRVDLATRCVIFGASA